MRRLLTASFLVVAACSPNPATAVPSPAALAEGGVWVAYNLGCKVGCNEIQRGDRIVAVDGQPVANGQQLDAATAAANPAAPSLVRVAKYNGPTIEVPLVATPHTDLSPIASVPPLVTVSANALDLAPDWARLPLFGHAIPAMRLYRGEEPRGFVSGRDLYGRGALLVIWELPWVLGHKQALWNELPHYYAILQAHQEALTAAEVDTYFVFTDVSGSRANRSGIDPPVVNDTPPQNEPNHAINKDTRDHIRSITGPVAGQIPMYYLTGRTGIDPNVLGLMHPASSIDRWLNDRVLAAIIIIIDHRGVVRWHSRDYPIGPEETLTAAARFSIEKLREPQAP